MFEKTSHIKYDITIKNPETFNQQDQLENLLFTYFSSYVFLRMKKTP